MCTAGYSRVTHPSAANPIGLFPEGNAPIFIARLACVRHAASVRPEPGSNSQLKFLIFLFNHLSSLKTDFVRFSFYFALCVYFVLTLYLILMVLAFPFKRLA